MCKRKLSFVFSSTVFPYRIADLIEKWIIVCDSVCVCVCCVSPYLGVWQQKNMRMVQMRMTARLHSLFCWLALFWLVLLCTPKGSEILLAYWPPEDMRCVALAACHRKVKSLDINIRMQAMINICVLSMFKVK